MSQTNLISYEKWTDKCQISVIIDISQMSVISVKPLCIFKDIDKCPSVVNNQNSDLFYYVYLHGNYRVRFESSLNAEGNAPHISQHSYYQINNRTPNQTVLVHKLLVLIAI